MTSPFMNVGSLSARTLARVAAAPATEPAPPAPSTAPAGGIGGIPGFGSPIGTPTGSAPAPSSSAAPPATPPAAPTARPLAASAIATSPIAGGVRIDPNLLATLAIPPRIAPELVPARQTITQLAQQAVARLRAADREPLLETLRTLQAKSFPPPDRGAEIIPLLERRTRIGEVMSTPAARWSSETVNDFAAAMQMDPQRVAIMDLVVAVGILSERTLEAELRQENMPAVTPEDLLQNRRIVYQYPPPGTELQPPYVILVAVEHQDLRRADDAVNAIIGQLVAVDGFRMPRDAAARIG